MGATRAMRTTEEARAGGASATIRAPERSEGLEGVEGSEGLDGSEGLEGLEGVLLEGAPWRGPCDVCGADAVTSDAVEHRGWLLRLAECRHCGHRATQRHPGTPQRAALRVHSVATRRPEVDSAA